MIVKVSPRACRHCGSPAKGNPCWWGIKLRNWSGDPPCVVFAYVERDLLRNRRFWFLFWLTILPVTAWLAWTYAHIFF